MTVINRQAEVRAFNYFRKMGMTLYGALGAIGNLEAESDGFYTNRMEYLLVSRLKSDGYTYTDGSYTAAIDSGAINKEKFLHPRPGCQYGYGLAQWTSPGRKEILWNWAKERNVSIADETLQLEYLIWELKNKYQSVWKILTTATSVRSASDYFLVHFESPANTGEAVRKGRADRGQKFYEYLKGEKMKKGKYDKYINSETNHYISNSGSDENSGYSGGKAGDQTGREWQLRSRYNSHWNCVLRHPNEEVGMKLAELACAAALNDLIGYDQNQRDTYWQHLKASNYDPAQITIACEADCSAGVIANTRAVGYLLGIDALKNLSASYTGNMRSGFKAAGFQVLTDSKYLTGIDYLLPGDILLNDAHHTATNVTKGKLAKAGSTPVENTDTSASTNGGKYMFSVGTVQSGTTGNDVKLLQRLLKSNGCKGKDGQNLTIDGSCGENTVYAIKQYQKKKKLEVDGCAGNATWKSILLR
ncbi:peptidoglycan-binding protein [Lachnospiraceae bacterium OF09-6]|nr:peptidoglycan-binding protein [Lachnospiraceae bacterium OF09-6]